MQRELDMLGVGSEVMRNFRYANKSPKSPFSFRPQNLLFISRVRIDKGILEAVNLCAELREQGVPANLSVYGPIEGSERELIEDSLAVEYVTYRGVLAGVENTLNVMSQYDLLIFPTRYPGEGIPGVLIEALFAGLPAVCTAWMDLSEVVEKDVNGFLLPIEDFVISAANLISGIDDQLLNEMSDKCQLKAEEYTPERAGSVLVEELFGKR